MRARWLVLSTLAIVGCSFPTVEITGGTGTETGTLPDASDSTVVVDGDATLLDATEASTPDGDATIDSQVAPDGDASGGDTFDASAPDVPDVADVADSTSVDTADTRPPDGTLDTFDTFVPDTFVPDTAVGDTRGDGEAGIVCDKDGDGENSKGICGGLDCDDDDNRANTKVTTFLTFPQTATIKGDWNCNGVVEKQFPVNVSCGLLSATCTSTKGFVGDPACGASGQVVQCEKNGLGLCVDGPKTTEIQGCR